MIRVLALDGGGIRAVIPAIVLAEMEELTQKPIASLFELIAGTSSGGLLAVGLAMRKADGSVRFSANDLLELYETRGAEIFSDSLWQRLRTIGGLLGEKHSPAGLERVLKQYFGDATLQDTVTNVMLTAYEIERRAPWFFRSWKAKSQPATRDFKLRDALRATSAAPTYFAPARLTAQGKKSHLTLIDGGVFANNPALCAYVEARLMHPNEDILLVSLGTGRTRESILYGSGRGWGAARWARPILAVVFDSASRVVDYQLTHLVGVDRYFRFQVELQRKAALDGASPDNIDRLRADAENLIEKESQRLRDLCSLLVNPASFPSTS